MGSYKITITATDNDNDRTLQSDSLTSVVSFSRMIVDDDIESPIISDITVENTLQNVIVTLTATDLSGIASFDLTIDAIPVIPINQSQLGDTYTFILKNLWIMEFGTHTVELTVTDADTDRGSIDQLFSIGSITFKVFIIFSFLI